MSQTAKVATRSGVRSNPEDMTWQGVRSKAPNLMDQPELKAKQNELNGTLDSSRQKVGMPSIQGEQSVYQQTLTDAERTQSMMVGSGYRDDGSNFPVTADLTRKNLSLQQPGGHQWQTLQNQQFAGFVGSDDSIHGGRSQQTAESRRSTSTKQQLKKVDYSDISVAMVRQQQAAAAALKGSRGQSLRASRFTNEQPTEAMMQSLPVTDQYQGANSNARFGSSIDVNFKRQIDVVKQNRAHSMMPPHMLTQPDETPLRIGRQGAVALNHNDSIYQSSVNQSINSGLGLTPKRLMDNRASEQINRKTVLFGNQTDQKAYGNRVPPILLANENKMKYMGHKHQTQVMQQQDFNASQQNHNFAYSQQMSPRGAHPTTANGASFLSRDAGSTAYSQPEDSMFQASEASMSQQRSRFPPNVLPKIGTANPEMNARFKRTTVYPEQRSREISDEQQLRGRQLSTAQPGGFKFAKSHAQSQQQRSRQHNQYNDTGFNWKQVEIRTNTNFDGTGRTSKPFGSTSASVHVPQAFRKKKLSPGQLLEMMQKVDHKGPISHKVVNSKEFERLAKIQADNDGGKPMVEKTIFIVKPIYVPVEVPVGKGGDILKDLSTFPLTSKKKIKIKNKVQKAIYMERPKPPNYMSANATSLDPPKSKKQQALAAVKSKKSKNTTAQMSISRSPSPFSNARNSHYATEALNQSSMDQAYGQHESLQAAVGQQQDDEETLTSRSRSRQESREKAKRDLKHLLESSSVIDQIFAKRQRKIEKKRRQEEERKQKEDEEYKEVLEANASLKDSLRGKGSTQSKMTLQKQLSANNNSAQKTSNDDKSSQDKKPVDTTKEFLQTINDQLHMAGAGIQIVMEESKNASWFKRRQIDEERLNKKYSHVRKWEVAPKTFQATELNADTLNAAKVQALKRGSAQKVSPGSGSFAEVSPVKSARNNRAGSIPQFQNSPSGGGLSDRRWKSPNQASANESEVARRGGSLSPARYGQVRGSLRVSQGGVRDSHQGMIAVHDQKNDNQLTVERVEAMRVMTKKLKKVAKMPIEFENKFCSHIDAGTSAQLIAAEDLARADKSNRFHDRWKDKEHRVVQEGFTDVPRHFYTNYKTNLIRDAHYMAKRIIDDHQTASPMQNEHLDSCVAKANQNNSISCTCKKNETKIDLKKKFRSFTGGVRSSLRSKNVLKTAHDLYKPYRPCRRTCCANHNPLFHAQRMQKEHLQRMHQSATKLMIMSVIPERPYSADSATRALQQYQKEIDYFKTQMHEDAREAKKRNQLRRLGSKISKRTQSIEGIAERGANEEEDPDRSLVQSPQLSVGFGSVNQFTSSNMKLMKDKLEGSFMLDDAVGLTQIECKYLLSVLKNRAIQANNIKENQFGKIYDKARLTLKMQMKKLLLKKQFYIIDKQYKLADNEKQTAENLIKIIARIIKMYEAQSEVHKIINYLEERLDNLREFRQECKKDELDSEKLLDLYSKLVQLSRRTWAEIRVLKSIEKTLQRPFMFHGVMYDEDHMFRQMRRKRLQILTMMPELASDKRMQDFLLQDGVVRNIHNIDRQQTELEEGELLWSDSEDEDDDDEGSEDAGRQHVTSKRGGNSGATSGGVKKEDLRALNRLNTSSHEKLDKLNSAVLMRRNTSI